MNSKKKKTDFAEYNRRCSEVIEKGLPIPETFIALIEIASEYDFDFPEEENSGEQPE